VNINNRPALRVGDSGVHAACCGPNRWTAQAGSATVFINGKPAFRMNDAALHCGGSGKLIEGSQTVIIGDLGGGGAGPGGGGSGGAVAGGATGGGAGAGSDSGRSAGATGTNGASSASGAAGESAASDAGTDGPGGTREERAYIEISLIDDEGRPVPYEPYLVKLPDGSERRGFLDGSGLAVVRDIPAGTCQICFPDLDGELWQPMATRSERS
jgi:hypothetical protein